MELLLVLVPADMPLLLVAMIWLGWRDHKSGLRPFTRNQLDLR